MAALSGFLKLSKEPKIVEGIHEFLGVPLSWFPWLGGAEIAGAIGILMGLAVPPIGIAAGAGLCLYFTGAVLTHVRAGDLPGILRPLPLLLLSVAALVLRILTV